MEELLCPFAELLILFPAIVLAYLPVKKHLRFPVRKMLLLGIPGLLCLILTGGFLCLHFHLHMGFFLAPVTLFLILCYCRSLKISHWKSVSIALAICAVFSCITGISRAIEATFHPNRSGLWFSPETSLIQCLICWAFVALAWYPASHQVVDLLDDDGLVMSWRIFWILPMFFIALNLFMTPIHPEILQTGRVKQGYTVICLALLLLLAFFYALFYLMAQSLNKNDQLRQQNQFLQMQRTQYETLRSSIAETRQARHDMRHHFSSLQALAARKAWTELEHYLAQASETVPSSELHLCENPALDGVASHYGMLCRQHQIPYSMELDFPAELPVAEMDLCLVFSNLVENACEASLRTTPEKREIHVKGYRHSSNVILLTVRNNYDGAILTKENVFQSSKRSGNGIGIQSVRRIAEKNGGYSHFTYENGVFQANVMLRG